MRMSEVNRRVVVFRWMSCVAIGVAALGLFGGSRQTNATSSAITPGASACFAVFGNPGDLALVNLTPVLASGPGDGQLVSSAVVTNPPKASSVNFRVGSADPNVAVAPVGPDGRVCFVNSVHSSVHLVADQLATVNASVVTLATPSGAPDRKVDTRRTESPVARAGHVCFAVSGRPGDLALVNLTPVLATGLGNGKLISSDVLSAPPTASNVNFGVGSVDPNFAAAPIGADGRICFVNSRDAQVDLVADHLATIDRSAVVLATPTGAPARSIDTRTTQPVYPGQSACFRVAGERLDLALVNLTPVRASGGGDGKIVSDHVLDPPVISNVNFAAGSVDPNVGAAGQGRAGGVCFFNSVHSVVDLVADHLASIKSEHVYFPTLDRVPSRKVDTRAGRIATTPEPIPLVREPATMRAVGTDRIAVIVCPRPEDGDGPLPTAEDIAAWANANVSPWYDTASNGLFTAVFAPHPRAAEEFSAGDECGGERIPAGFTNLVTTGANFERGGGYAFSAGVLKPPLSPPDPSWARSFTVNGAVAGTWVHELGHTLYWSHNFTGGETGSVYDNPVDVMSAGDLTHTVAFNRLAAGWIDEEQVARHAGPSKSYKLDAVGGEGLQMVALVDPSRPYALMTLEARPAVGLDDALGKSGIAVHVVDQSDYPHPEFPRVGTKRRIRPAVGAPWSYGHVLGPGESLDVDGVTVEVLSGEDDSFTVQVAGSYVSGGPEPDPSIG
ncbi:MAG: hypothetical protein RIB65_00565 [Ilumatobacter fluminis]